MPLERRNKKENRTIAAAGQFFNGFMLGLIEPLGAILGQKPFADAYNVVPDDDGKPKRSVEVARQNRTLGIMAVAVMAGLFSAATFLAIPALGVAATTALVGFSTIMLGMTVNVVSAKVAALIYGAHKIIGTVRA